MEDKQKVYIKGNPKRGKDVINFLKDLGGRNTKLLLGVKENAYYFINPNGVIDYDYNYTFSPIIPYVKEFYKEITLPRWKPEYREIYYFIDCDGIIVEEVWYNLQIDKSRFEFGNCFKGIEEAKVARDKIKEMLKNQ